MQYDDEEQQLLWDREAQKEGSEGEGRKEEGTITPSEEGEQKEVVHKVQYGDTLQGLSLEYSVPIGKIKYRNHIEGDAIYHLKQIIIPNPQCIPLSKQKTEQLLVEEFTAHMDYKEKDRKVARYYLMEADWNMQAAMLEYKNDLEWEKLNKPKMESKKIESGQMEVEMREIRRFYDRQELAGKKTQ